MNRGAEIEWLGWLKVDQPIQCKFLWSTFTPPIPPSIPPPPPPTSFNPNPLAEKDRLQGSGLVLRIGLVLLAR